MSTQRHFVVQCRSGLRAVWKVESPVLEGAFKVERFYFNNRVTANSYVASLRVLYGNSRTLQHYLFRVIELVEMEE